MNPTDPKAAPSAAARPTLHEPSPLDALIDKPMQRYLLALEPQSFDGAWKIAELCAKMALCGCKTPEDAYLRIMAGRAIGLPAMAAVQSIVPIWNKKTESHTLTMYVKAKLALTLSRPDIIEYCRPKVVDGVQQLTDTRAVFVGKRKDGIEQEYEFTIEMAKTAGLVGRGADGGANNNYDLHPRAMLAWRACGRLLDLIAGDILTGIASAEDLEEEDERETVARVLERGQVPSAVKEQIKARDWAAERDALKEELNAALNGADSGRSAALKVVRAKLTVFHAEAPPDIAADIQRYYVTLTAPRKEEGAPGQPVGNGKKTEAAKPEPKPAETKAATPPSAARGQWLPPNQRGDAYDGPEDKEPPPPFGAT